MCVCVCVCVCGGGGRGDKNPGRGGGMEEQTQRKICCSLHNFLPEPQLRPFLGAPGDVQQPRTSPQEASHSKWVTVGSMLKP